MDIKEQADPIITWSLTDKWGNQFTCVNGAVSLKLAAEGGRIRKIGKIYYDNYETNHGRKVRLITYEKKEKEEDIMHQLNAWSIFSDVMERVQVIKYRTKFWDYVILAEKAKKVAIVKHFLDAGIERKIYVNLLNWHRVPRVAKKKKKKAVKPVGDPDNKLPIKIIPS